MCVRAACVAAVLLGLGACGPVADGIDARLNPVADFVAAAGAAPSQAAVHDRLFVADLHADTLMWERDLLRRGRWGHVDVPRLRQGGVDLQVFTVVTQTPSERHRPYAAGGPCIPSDGLNTTGLLSVAQLRPMATWFDLAERALYQARRLEDAARRSRVGRGTELVLVRSAADLARVVTAERDAGNVLGALLGVEGAHWIAEPDGSPETVRRRVLDLFEAGFRSLALTHRFDNALAGASEGCHRPGLTAQGAAALEQAEALGMVVDLSHLAPTALRQALGLLRQPPIVTHTGVQAHCAHPCVPRRNLEDADVVAIARKGGVIGIGFWPEAIGPGGLDGIVQAFARTAEVLRTGGIDDPWHHLAFGSDFDGAVEVPFDATGLPRLTEALRLGRPGAPGLSADALARVAGGNVCRLLALRLPGGGAAAQSAICDMARPG